MVLKFQEILSVSCTGASVWNLSRISVAHAYNPVIDHNEEEVQWVTGHGRLLSEIEPTRFNEYTPFDRLFGKVDLSPSSLRPGREDLKAPVCPCIACARMPRK